MDARRRDTDGLAVAFAAGAWAWLRTGSGDAGLLVTWKACLRRSDGGPAVTCLFGLVMSCCVPIELDV
jgi:hypothetical protein